MRAIAIVNPISGRRDVSAILGTVARELAASKCSLAMLPTHGPGDARRMTADAPDGTRAILVVGGDGTVREVAAGLAGRDIPMAVYPAGTENIVARYLRMPTDPAEIAAMILRRTVIPHDLGTLNGHPFVIVCGAGFDGEVVERLALGRLGHIGYQSYFDPLWQTFRHHKFPFLSIETDGEILFEGRGMVFVGVQPRYALGMRILAKAVHDDGRLDVCIFPCDGKLTLVGHAFRTLFRRHANRGGVLYRKCQSAVINSPNRVPIQCDGDPAGTLPARIGMLPSALKVLSPH